MRAASLVRRATAAACPAAGSAPGVVRLSSSRSGGKDAVRITPRDVDYARWYRDVIAAADLVDTAPVKGCMVMRPHGFAVWEALRDALDKRIKATGHVNACFPLLIPQSFLSKEAEHVAGFAKECAVVTHHRLRAVPDGDGSLEPDPTAVLAEPLVVRPTSEAIIWHTYRKWVRSHRDLPLLINQWANVVRWEMRTRPFLRTTEFLWQEGHTAHATEREARDEAATMLREYQRVAEETLAVPVIPGVKSPSERFAGAEDTLTIEAMMQNGWALQAGTSHFLGQNFAKAFDVMFSDEDEQRRYVWATSWGVSTRMVGAMIMTHSDDTGLVLPPKVAPIQVVVVPILGKKGNDDVLAAAQALYEAMQDAGLRVRLDDRSYVRPAAKYFEWERKGVPLRVEIGARDVAAGVVTVRSRIVVGGSSRFTWNADVDRNVADAVALLDGVQDQLLEEARSRLHANIVRVDSYDEMRDALGVDPASHGDGDREDGSESGSEADDHEEGLGRGASFFIAPWADDAVNEAAIKADCKATIRCFPFGMQDEARGKECFYSGEPATHMALFARAY